VAGPCQNGDESSVSMKEIDFLYRLLDSHEGPARSLIRTHDFVLSSFRAACPVSVFKLYAKIWCIQIVSVA
jgi:hypothetical protein